MWWGKKDIKGKELFNQLMYHLDMINSNYDDVAQFAFHCREEKQSLIKHAWRLNWVKKDTPRKALNAQNPSKYTALRKQKWQPAQSAVCYSPFNLRPLKGDPCENNL